MRALEATLSKVNLNNTSYRGSFRPGGSTQALQMRQQLRDKLDRAYDRMKIARSEERNLQNDIDQCKHRYESMKSEIMSVQALVADFEERTATIQREIDENTERMKAAHRQLNRIIADNNAQAGEDSTFTFDIETLSVVDRDSTAPASSEATTTSSETDVSTMAGKTTTATLETVDVMSFQQKELFREIMSELRKINDAHPEINISEKVAEAGT